MATTFPTPETLFDRNVDDLLHPPEAIAKFVERMIRNAQYYSGPERREERRYALAIPMSAVPLDATYQRAGDLFVAVSRDISTRSAALFHSRRVYTPHLAVELTAPGGEKLRVVLKVLRCRPVGMFYQIAGPFVSRLGD
jgi:hypothetical protein